MGNKTIFNRAEHNESNPYLCFPKTIIGDRRLSFLEIGIMAYILNQPKGWVVKKNLIYPLSGFGASLFNQAWAHLIELRYLERVRIKSGVIWVVNEKPQTNEK